MKESRASALLAAEEIPPSFRPRPVVATSEAARRWLLSLPGEPLFIADWDRALMIHFEVDRDELQKAVPFQVDLIEGRAYLTLVAFTMRGMRPRFGGLPLAWLLRPIATHHFLNVRTYVRCDGEAGICFLAEWLANRLSVKLGPAAFGLPYRFGKIHYDHEQEKGLLKGCVTDPRGGALSYHGRIASSRAPAACAAGSLAEKLMERYTAFTHVKGRSRFFRVWHPPWRQQCAEITLTDQTLLESKWSFFRQARPVGANYSPGLKNVWMGWPHDLSKL
jgi:uncharacterized protein YqjF (DUF2071 family)